MKCKYCNSEMRLDDVDFNFKGNKDNYWECDTCNATALEKIRYGKSINVKFQEAEEISEEEEKCDYCEKCIGCGYDYYKDENGELVSSCYNCPHNCIDDFD